MLKRLIFIFILIFLNGCFLGGGYYVPGQTVVYTYDENTNAIEGLKVTYTLIVTKESNIQYTDTNGKAMSKIFVPEYSFFDSFLPPKELKKKYNHFAVAIEDIDGAKNGEFYNVYFDTEPLETNIFMKRKL